MKWTQATAFIEKQGLALVLALGLIVRLVRITMPPLYYFLLHFWMGAGSWLGAAQSAWFLRLLSVFLSLAAVCLLYWLVLQLFDDRRSALLAAFMAAISPFQYYHAQDVRNYALLLCAELGYLCFFVKIWKSDAKRWTLWLGLGLCALTAMYTHNVAVFALGLPNLFLLAQRRWKLFGQLVLAQVVVSLLTLPWLIELPGQLSKVQRAWWLWGPGVIDLVQVPIVWTSGLPLPGIWLWVGALLGLEISAVLILEALKIRNERGVRFLALITLALPALMFVASYIVRPIFVPRVFILSAAAYTGLLSRAITLGWKGGGGKILLGGFLAAALIGLPAQAGFASFPRSPFEQAAGDLARRIQAGELVLHDNKLSYFPFRFYQPALKSAFIGDEPGSSNDTFAPGSQQAMEIYPAADLPSAVGDASRLYFIVFTETIQNYKANGVDRHPSLAWLDQHFHLIERKVYDDLEVYEYARP
jgi:mannosyltransferase